MTDSPPQPSGRAIPAAKQAAVTQWPCDGVKRFKVGGRSLTYAEAFGEIFLDSGGQEVADDAGKVVRRVHTRESVRRLGRLNVAYAPQIKLLREGDVAVRPADEMAGVRRPCPICGGEIERGKVVVCVACFEALASADRAEMARAFKAGSPMEGIVAALKAGHPRAS